MLYEMIAVVRAPEVPFVSILTTHDFPGSGTPTTQHERSQRVRPLFAIETYPPLRHAVLTSPPPLASPAQRATSSSPKVA